MPSVLADAGKVPGNIFPFQGNVVGLLKSNGNSVKRAFSR